MRIVLPVLFAGIGLAQNHSDPASLIQAVAETARSVSSWRIEGTVEYSGQVSRSTGRFRLLMQSPGKTRYEEVTNTVSTIVVCNGADAWLYSPPLRRYRKDLTDGNKLCSPFVGDWKLLPTTLQSPKNAGSCGPDPKLKTSEYQLIRGYSEPEITSAGRITRTLCIDPGRKQVVWEKWAVGHDAQMYRYFIADQPAEYTPGAFAFDPPPGTILTNHELPAPVKLGMRAYPRDPSVTMPRPVSAPEPSYTPEARSARLEGTVLLWVIIDTKGVPYEVLVYRPLTPDLDAEAVRTVRRWRFTPAMRNGVAIEHGATIEVNFRMR
jgi:TonB family protein